MTEDRHRFKAVFTDKDGVKTISVNSCTIEELASYNEHEWDFADGISLPSNDVEDGELEYLQCTGLKDKNGTLIYEGDRISFIETDEDSCMGAEEMLSGVITYIPECAQFRCEYPSGQRRELSTIIGFHPVRDVTIIGNSFERPITPNSQTT